MSRKTNSRGVFGTVGRFFSGAAGSIAFARDASAIANTPESNFRARGTTRQQALRDLIDRS